MGIGMAMKNVKVTKSWFEAGSKEVGIVDRNPN
jgi:hypothetical protein